MKKRKILYTALLMMMFSVTSLQAGEQEAPVVISGIQELKLEDAIAQAQKRNKKLKMQQTNIEYAKVSSDSAEETYYNSWNVGFEHASANYSQARINAEYERKNEGIIAEQVAYSIEEQFDHIIELEERQQLLEETLKIQRQKLSHAQTKEQLGLGSKASTKAEETKLDVQNKEMESLIQSIDAAYRKLNDAIGGKEERYELIKENTYEPLDMKRSLQGQISYSIDSDLGLWLQEESAGTQGMILTAPAQDGYAPTYAEYQKRKLNYQQALNNVSLSKEGKEEQIKQIYENILALEIQHDKILLDIDETQRQYEIMAKRHELGMITDLSLEEMELALLQNQVQLSSIVRQHNQLKVLFDKSYLATAK